MFYVAVFILFVSCILLLVKIIESVNVLSNSIDVVTSSIEKFRLDNGQVLDDVVSDLATCHLLLREIEKKVV